LPYTVPSGFGFANHADAVGLDTALDEQAAVCGIINDQHCFHGLRSLGVYEFFLTV
jgi:hypothetical protein